MAAELLDFRLERALEMGLVPLVVDSADPKATLSAYVGVYMEQEVQAALVPC